jgi:hypothetical protein
MICQHCDEGLVVKPHMVRVPSGAVIGTVTWEAVCDCCEGDWRNCERCEQSKQEERKESARE